MISQPFFRSGWIIFFLFSIRSITGGVVVGGGGRQGAMELFNSIDGDFHLF